MVKKIGELNLKITNVKFEMKVGGENMPSNGKLLQERYQCEKCGTFRTINRLSKKKIGHKKHMLCIVCKKKKAKFIKVE